MSGHRSMNTDQPKPQLPSPLDRLAPHARHISVLMRGCVLSVARIPWLRAPITTRAKWPADGMRQRVATTSEDQR